MAIIQTIRDKYAKVAGGVIVLALVGFVLMDLGKGGMNGNTTVAKIDGEKVDINSYINLINQRRNEIATSRNNQPLSEQEEEQLKEEVWNEILSNILLEDYKEKLGVDVTEAEIKDMFGGSLPDANVIQAFGGQQNFDPAAALAEYKKLEAETNPAQKAQWTAFKNNLITNRLRTKIGALVGNSIFTPTAVLDIQSKLRNTVASGEIVQIPYTIVNDDKAVVTDEEITKYIQDNKSMFESKVNSNEMDVVVVPYMPSAVDSSKLFSELDSLKSQFIAATDATEFANAHSSQTTQAQYLTKEMLSSLPNGEEIFAANIGTVVGPFAFQANEYALAKVLNKATFADSVTVNYIAVFENDMQSGSVIRTKDEAAKKIDSLAAVVKSGTTIESIAATASEDARTNQNGGKLDLQSNMYTSIVNAFGKDFANFAYNANVGESKIIYSETGIKGYYYVNITSKSANSTPQSEIIFLTKQFLPSEETKQDINTKATQLQAAVAKDPTSLEKEALTLGLTKRSVSSNPNTKLIQNLGVSGELVDWANKANVNDVSPIFLMNGNYVVAKLNSKVKKGEIVQSDMAKDYVRNILRNEKKATIIKQTYDSKSDIATIASESGQAVTAIENFSYYSPNNALLSGDPKALGGIFSKNVVVNQVSKGINGFQGVYYVKVNSINQTPSTARNINTERLMNVSTYKANGYNILINNKMSKADINDYRSKFLKMGL